MPSDPLQRGAARTATLVAVPLAIVVFAVSALTFGNFGRDEPAPAATGPVSMTTRDLPPEVEAACRLLVSKLPETVAGSAQRPVTAGPEQNAAYGDPPIMLECGTPPPTVGPTDEVINLAPPEATGGICWHAIDGDNRTVWTTVDRQVPVTVTVPGPREGSAQSVVPFARAIGESLPPLDTDEIPTGCSVQPTTS
jgi:uncharacterized protein DUF3515